MLLSKLRSSGSQSKLFVRGATSLAILTCLGRVYVCGSGQFLPHLGVANQGEQNQLRFWVCLLSPESFCVNETFVESLPSPRLSLLSNPPFISPFPPLFLCIPFGKCYSSLLLPLCRSGRKPSCVLWARLWPQTMHGKNNKTVIIVIPLHEHGALQVWNRGRALPLTSSGPLLTFRMELG